MVSQDTGIRDVIAIGAPTGADEKLSNLFHDQITTLTQIFAKLPLPGPEACSLSLHPLPNSRSSPQGYRKTRTLEEVHDYRSWSPCHHCEPPVQVFCGSFHNPRVSPSLTFSCSDLILMQNCKSVVLTLTLVIPNAVRSAAFERNLITC